LALPLPVSLPAAIECQPTRALDVGAIIAVAGIAPTSSALVGWHSMAAGNDTGKGNANG